MLALLDQTGASAIHAAKGYDPWDASLEEAVAKIDVTFTEPQPVDYNWWLLIGAPLAGVVLLALIVFPQTAQAQRQGRAVDYSS